MVLCYENSINNTFVIDQYKTVCDWYNVGVSLLKKYNCYKKKIYETAFTYAFMPHREFYQGTMMSYILPNNTVVIATYGKSRSLSTTPEYHPLGVVKYTDDSCHFSTYKNASSISPETFFEYIKNNFVNV